MGGWVGGWEEEDVPHGGLPAAGHAYQVDVDALDALLDLTKLGEEVDTREWVGGWMKSKRRLE